jgi:hypothetical protein
LQSNKKAGIVSQQQTMPASVNLAYVKASDRIYSVPSATFAHATSSTSPEIVISR